VRYEHLYVHVPFCARRCTYCDFSIAVRAKVPSGEFVDAVRAEWKSRHSGSTFTLDTLYFGGGTPSKLGGEGVARMMDMVREHSALNVGAEVTLEANPEDISVDSVRQWRASGVNRLSIGVQSFDDRVLKWMHRTHDATRARAAVADAREGGIENISIDLIFAVPLSVERVWRSDLDIALGLQLPHISVYGLTVEPQTPLGRWVARHETVEAPEESFEGEFLMAHEALTGAGFDHYEVSNYGTPGRHSRHNWAYWRRKPYGGLGPSAHEFTGEERSWNAEAFATWQSVAVSGNETVAGRETLAPDQVASESLYLGLRTTDGIVASEENVHASRKWVQSGWARVEGETLRLTPQGWLRLDTLASDLTLRPSRY
jgi:oxygen-independent coproporphyrinogen-3 oxidase